MRPDATALATSRPVRIAYVVEDGPDGHQWLTEVVNSCFSRSGGRQSLIVPLVDGEIPPRYATWLRALDPEVVCLITYSNAQIVASISGLVGDTMIVGCARNREGPQEHPRIRFESAPLTSLSWIPFLRTVSGNLRVAPEQILDAFPRWNDDGLITDNFGTLIHGFGRWPLYTELSDYVKPLILAPTNPPPDRRIAGLGEHEEIADAYEVLDRISGRGKLVTVAQLSNLEPHPLSVAQHNWTGSFCIVVGDTFMDRVSCWNAGLLHGDGRNQTYKTLRLPSSIIGNEERIRRVSEFLRKNNWINQEHGGSVVSVRSHSIDAATLRQFADSLQAIYHNRVRSEVIESAEDCCPVSAENIRPGERREYPAAETRLREASASVRILKPHQLGYALGVHPIFATGCWCVDLQIDRLTTDTRYENRGETWTLPPHKALAQQFNKTHPARVLSNGNLSIQVQGDVSSVDIAQPTDEAVLRILLHSHEEYPYPDLRRAPPARPAYLESRPSDKGRYLKGVLGLFGSLTRASQVLANHFWRTQLQNLAAPSRDRYPEVVEQLQRRLQARDGHLVINDAEGWETLARRVTEISSQLRVPRYAFKYEELERKARTEVEAAIAGDENLTRQRDEILNELPDELKEALAGLCGFGVFHRGHGWSCRRCSHRNWRAVDRLANIVPCEVCHAEEQLPIDLNLSFRLNEFLATCLREHDTLSVLAALSVLRESAHRCFVYAPQTDLFRNYPESRRAPVDRELDVLCLVDGMLTVGEVKASVNEIAATDIADLAGVANELKVGQAVLIAVEGDRGRLDLKVQELRTQLDPRIEAKGLLLSEHGWDDRPEWSLSVSVFVVSLFGP